MQDYKHLFTKTALELTKSYINFMRQPWIFPYKTCELGTLVLYLHRQECHTYQRFYKWKWSQRPSLEIW